MTFILLILVAAVPAYILGGVNGAIIISKLIYRKDIREYGSGNPGLTNFYRTFGKKAVLPVIIIDMVKSMSPVIFAGWLFGHFTDMALSEVWPINLIYVGSFFGQVLAAFFVMLGHCFPVFYKFKGGKGVMAVGAAVIVIDWRLALISWSIFVIIVAMTRYVSLGAILATSAFPLFTYVFRIGGPWELSITIMCALLVIARHEANIRRLIKGEESKFSLRRKNQVKQPKPDTQNVNPGDKKSFKEYLDRLKEKRVAVIGAGVSNTPLIEALLKAGIKTTVRDKRSNDELGGEAERFISLGATLRLGEGYQEGLNEDTVFRTPGLMPTNPALEEAVKRGAVLTSEMEVFFEVCPCKIIAVTGSDGKTTTTSIIAELLKNEGRTVHLGGNIGRPLLCEADSMDPEDMVVLELSSFQLITMKKSPDVAVVTNLSPNHLDIHRDMDEYIEAKRNIVAYQKDTDRAVFNMDNGITRDYADSAAAGEVLFFSRSQKVTNGVYLDNGVIYEAKNGEINEIMPAEEILLPGLHNIENCMAAFAAVQGMVSNETMRETARTFRAVKHRIELVRGLRGVSYYNDSIASSPTRTIAGLKAFDQKVILIAGGKSKGVAFDELGAEIVRHVKTLVLTGSTAQQIRDAVINVPGFTEQPEIHMCEDFKDAVLFASKNAKEGDIVLLSPACTSFDRFKNFEERGDVFRDIINGLE